jgi:hypothetical protein
MLKPHTLLKPCSNQLEPSSNQSKTMLKPIENHAQTTYHVQTNQKPCSNQTMLKPHTLLKPCSNQLEPSSNQSKTMLKPHTTFKPCSNQAQTNQKPHTSLKP